MTVFVFRVSNFEHAVNPSSPVVAPFNYSQGRHFVLAIFPVASDYHLVPRLKYRVMNKQELNNLDAQNSIDVPHLNF